MMCCALLQTALNISYVCLILRQQHTQLVSLPRHDSLRSCCQAEAVQSQCLDICTFRLDFDLLSLEGNTCNQDFPAYMKCGADQSDHRHCCQQAGVSEGIHQVWSLTQFYSVDFSLSRIDVKKCVFNKRTIKVCVSCC